MADRTKEYARRWACRPEGSNWGEFGPDDQLGSLNYITKEQVLHAVQTITHGLRFCLSLPLDYPGGRELAPHRSPPVLRPTTRHDKPYFNYDFDREAPSCCDVGCDDQVTLSTQYSTQWDSFAHIGHKFDRSGNGQVEQCYYNGYVAGQDIRMPEDRTEETRMPLGIDAFAATPIQTRGVMLDIAHHFGRDYQNLTFEHIRHILTEDGIEILPGDVLCLHTGFADEILGMKKQPDKTRLHNMCAALDGRDEALLGWITQSRISAIAADNFAVERVGLAPLDDLPAFVPLHYHCLFKRGIPLGELWLLTPLALWLRANGRTDFLLTAPPLRLPGAVGSPVTPVATV